MPKYFTHYWKNQTWDWNRKSVGKPLEHTAGNLFRRRQIGPGDSVYIVTNLEGELYLCGKLIVSRICDAEKAVELLRDENLWQADEHILAARATPMDFDLKVPEAIARQLLFLDGKDGTKPLTFKPDGCLDEQTLRGVRRLTEKSAFELDQLLPKLEDVFIEDEPDTIRFPEEIPTDEAFLEGAIKQVLVNRYERDSKAREACLAHYGLSCSVCGFNFGFVYGPAGEGLIHVHHLKPLSEIGEEYQVDPIADLRPICPNCHAMIHRKNPPYSIEEVMTMLRRPSTVAA